MNLTKSMCGALALFCLFGCQESEFETKEFTQSYLQDNPKKQAELKSWCEENKNKSLGNFGMKNCELIKMLEDSKLRKKDGSFLLQQLNKKEDKQVHF